jgi:hypothetical protein
MDLLIVARFRSHHLPTTPEECWLWQSVVEKNGYGRLTVEKKGKRKHYFAHRLAYEIEYGPIPSGLKICHECDTPACVNHHHLYAGTHDDNMRDMILRGRNPGQHVKLTDLEVEEIKSLRFKATGLKVALRFGISYAQVYRIWRGERHK